MATSNVKQDVKEELQTYLKDKGINALFVSIVESLLVEKPDEPVSFVFQFLMVSTVQHRVVANRNLSNSPIYLTSYFHHNKISGQLPHANRGVISEGKIISSRVSN